MVEWRINHYHILTFHARLTHHQYPCACGILPKNCRVAPPPLDMQTAPCDTWHRSFHSGISHPKFFSADIPPGYLTFGILLLRHSTWISHIRNSVRPTFNLLRISHIRNPVCRCSTFPGYLASGILSGRRSTFFSILRAFSWGSQDPIFNKFGRHFLFGEQLSNFSCF